MRETGEYQGKYSKMSRLELLGHYERIIEISQILSSTFDHVALLEKIISAAAELINTEAASIMLHDASTGQLRFAIASNIKAQEMEDIIIPLEGSIAGWIFTHGEPRVIENAQRDPNHYQGVDTTIGFQSRNLLGVPMRTHNRTIGVLQAVNKRDNESFTSDDVTTLTTLASQAGIAIENARLFQQSDFIAELVHELRNPLAALKTSLTLMERRELGEEKRAGLIDTMKGETDRLIRLTNEFLDLARLESGRERLEMTPFEMHKLMVETVDIVVSQAAEKGVTVHIQEGEQTVKGDRGKVKQVVLNMLTNAIKYNRPNGDIYLSYEPILDKDGQSMIRIAVADTGYGISKEHQRNMFQKFYRVPALTGVAHGTGLGLAITKHIVEAHGGNIWLESEEGVGSTFYFTLQPGN